MGIPDAQALPLTRSQFIDLVLSLKPRVAAFDCDGTLWSSDAGETFFDWEIRNGMVPSEIGHAMRARYAEYKQGRVGEAEMCGEMVTMHKGIADDAMMRAATEFMAHAFPGKAFAEMAELVQRLRSHGCDIWVVSSSNEWVIRAGVKQFGIPEDRVVATKARLENGIVTDHLERIPTGPDKPRALRGVLGKRTLDAAFGNSRWDTEMLGMAEHAFAVNPNPDLESTALQRGWNIYFPQAVERR